MARYEAAVLATRPWRCCARPLVLHRAPWRCPDRSARRFVSASASASLPAAALAAASSPALTAAPSTRLPYVAVPKRPTWQPTLMGLGSYRLDLDEAQHRAALAAALCTHGVTLVDTSDHFQAGRSEALIGAVLRETAAQRAGRPPVIVVTKAGFAFTPAAAAEPEARRVHASSAGGTTTAHDGVVESYSLHPATLEKRLAQSEARLGRSVDVLMLNSPERLFLTALPGHRPGHGVDLDHVVRAIRAAATWLEAQTEAGRIGGWGIASSTMHDGQHPHHLPLDRILSDLAVHQLDRHLVALEVPYNIMEQGALVRPRHDVPSLRELAQQHQLWLLTQRPLLTLGLPPRAETLSASESASGTRASAGAGTTAGLRKMGLSCAQLQAQHGPQYGDAASLTPRFRSAVDAELQALDVLEAVPAAADAPSDRAILAHLTWAQTLGEHLPVISTNALVADHFLRRTVRPSLDQARAMLAARLQHHRSRQADAKDADDADDDAAYALDAWSQRYFDDMAQLVEGIQALAEMVSGKSNDDLAGVLASVAAAHAAQHGDAAAESRTLAHQALRVCFSEAKRYGGISTLVGARSPHHVDSAVHAALAPAYTPETVAMMREVISHM
ncbi:hypothetical protein CXG81DRAFT_25840 [Caulochytrium protostelioides]|uniref:NADP-dependent oxidoreductase domain-containing protein n=1 Tax=Caulochytrium protostelioides TaxID=1555241 RepID=A0A4P9X876_9FUNG|nr:hypothetical protein CXG81DRAFT_25840 [Caulochytrium protostelioides]|eukprot:RKP01455.1 hypothetical protein CXG81DRAFT_25840 [Caulochytrium protostelioides]